MEEAGEFGRDVGGEELVNVAIGGGVGRLGRGAIVWVGVDLVGILGDGGGVLVVLVFC